MTPQAKKRRERMQRLLDSQWDLAFAAGRKDGTAATTQHFRSAAIDVDFFSFEELTTHTIVRVAAGADDISVRLANRHVNLYSRFGVARFKVVPMACRVDEWNLVKWFHLELAEVIK